MLSWFALKMRSCESRVGLLEKNKNEKL